MATIKPILYIQVTNSSNIAGYAYNRKSKSLLVDFKGGKKSKEVKPYQYFGVTPEEYEALQKAESKGRFISNELQRVNPKKYYGLSNQERLNLVAKWDIQVPDNIPDANSDQYAK